MIKRRIKSTVHHCIVEFADPALVRRSFDWIAASRALGVEMWVIMDGEDRGLGRDNLFTSVFSVQEGENYDRRFGNSEDKPRLVDMILAMRLDEIKDTEKLANEDVLEIINDLTFAIALF